jgi:Peptidase M15
MNRTDMTVYGAAVLAMSSLLSGNALSAPCGDERDSLVAEYVQANGPFKPSCGDFTRESHSAHFTFAELNSGDFSWAILRAELLAGIEQTRQSYGDPLNVNSGYRNPAHQQSVNGAVIDSRHVHGDAVDFASVESTWKRVRDAGKQAGACAEPLVLSGSAHVHLDWRGPCPVNW